MLSSADVTRMRTIYNQSLAGTAVIHNGTLASDSGGGYTETFAPRTGGTVSYRLAPITGREGEEGGRINADAEYVVSLPAATTVETDDRIVIGAITYNVVAVRDRSPWEIGRRVEVQKVT